MPHSFNPGGPSNPSWSLGDLGGETYQGPANAGSNNFARGKISNAWQPHNQSTKMNSNRGFMPNLNSTVGRPANNQSAGDMTGAPPWAIGNWGNETWIGPGNAGSNNYALGPINGQTTGNTNMKPKGPRFTGNEGPGAQNSFGVDAFGFPISSASAASGVGLQQLNAYRDYNQAVQNWINQTGFTGEGGYSAFQLANPNWVSQYGPMTGGGALGNQQGAGGFGSGQPWSPPAGFGTMPNAQGQMVPSIGNPTPGASGQPGPPRLPPQAPPPGQAGTNMGTGQPVNYGGSGANLPTTPSSPTGLQQGSQWAPMNPNSGGNGGR